MQRYLLALYLLLGLPPFVYSASPLQVDTLTMTSKPESKDDSTHNWLTEGWSKGSIKMPFVRAQPSLVAERINHSLYLSQLGMPAPVNPGNSFEPPDGRSPYGTRTMEFDVVRNDGRLLTIELLAEGCGAYCEEYSTFRSFDVSSGRSITVPDLLSRHGLIDVARRMQDERKTRYQQQIASLSQELKAAKQESGEQSDASDTEARLAFNEYCLDRVVSASNVESELVAAGHSFDFIPKPNGFVFISSRCSAHADRALDDVHSVELFIPNADLPALLTPYGRALQLGDASPTPTPSPFGQILRGRIGTAAITMQLAIPYSDGSLEGIYFYDEYREAIDLTGRQTGSRIELTETVHEQPQAMILLTRSDQTLKGRWRGKGKDLPIEVSWQGLAGEAGKAGGNRGWEPDTSHD